MSEIIAGLTEFFADIDWGALSGDIVQWLKTIPAVPFYIMMWIVAGVSFIFESVLGMDISAATEPIMAVLNYIGTILVIP